MPNVENLPNKQHTDYSVTRTSIHKPGLTQMPAAGPIGEPCIFVRDHAPYEQEVVVCECKCEGGPPTLPSPFGPDSPLGLNANSVLLDWQMSVPISIPIGGSAGHVTIITCTAIYGKYQPDGIVRNYPTGKLPYEAKDVKDDYFPSANFRQGILDPTSIYQAPIHSVLPPPP